MNAQLLVWLGFIVLPVAVAIAIAWAGKSRALTFAIAGWMGFAAVLAQSGVLSHFNWLPPPIALLFTAGFAGTIAVGCSSLVESLVKLPFAVLIGFQAFRIIVEILIHKASSIGLAPPQMSWSGYNFDIITGLSAFCLAPFARSAPRWLLLAWNCLGLTLLAIVIGIAVVSFPTRFQLMQPSNTWVATYPYVWLPTILVTAALLGHMVMFRKLRTERARHL